MGCPETKLAPFTTPPVETAGVRASASPAVTIIKGSARIRIEAPVFTIVERSASGQRLRSKQIVNIISRFVLAQVSAAFQPLPYHGHNPVQRPTAPLTALQRDDLSCRAVTTLTSRA